MSSDLKEVKELKEVLSRKKVSKIKKKYHSAEKKVYRKMLKCDDENESEILLKCTFIEFRKRYFGDLLKRVDEIVNGAIASIEPTMREFVNEKKRIRVFEVLILIKNILNRNGIRWALMEEYLKCRDGCISPENICIVVCKEHINKAVNIFNIIGECISEGIYIINNVEVHLSFGFALNNVNYNLSINNIKYYQLEGEEIPLLEVNS